MARDARILWGIGLLVVGAVVAWMPFAIHPSEDELRAERDRQRRLVTATCRVREFAFVAVQGAEGMEQTAHVVFAVEAPGRSIGPIPFTYPVGQLPGPVHVGAVVPCAFDPSARRVEVPPPEPPPAHGPPRPWLLSLVLWILGAACAACGGWLLRGAPRRTTARRSRRS
jgi:hypothetical protein